jgi:predicted permease
MLVIEIQTIDALITQILLFYTFIIAGYLVALLSGKGPIINKHLNSLLINVLVPILIFYTFLTSTSTSIVEIPVFLVIAVLIHLLGPALLHLRLRHTKFDSKTKGSLFICSAFNNALFIPLPLALIFIGPSAVSFVIMFSLTQMILLVTLGSIMGATFGGKEAGWKKIAKDAVTFPPFLAAMLSLVFLGLNVGLPLDLSLMLSYNSPLTTYLALVSVGLGIGVRFSLADIRTALNVVAIRQLIIPLFIIPIILFSHLSQIPFQVLFLESLMPPAILTVVYASGFDLDIEIASTTVTVGTLLVLPLIPILPFILG